MPVAVARSAEAVGPDERGAPAPHQPARGPERRGTRTARPALRRSWPPRARAGGRCSRSGRPATAKSPYSAQSAFAGNPRAGQRRAAHRRRPAARRRIAAAARKRCARAFAASAAAAPSARGFEAFAPRAPPGSRTSRSTAPQARARRDAMDVWPAPLRDREPARAGRRAASRSPKRSRSCRSCSALRPRLAALRDHAAARGIGAHGRHADLRGARQRRRVAAAASSSTSTERGEPTRRRRRAARLLQRDRPALGQPALPLGRMRRDGLRWWMARFRATLSRFDVDPPRSFRGFDALLGGPGRRADRINGRWLHGPGARFFDAVASGARRAAARRRGPRRRHARGEGAAR